MQHKLLLVHKCVFQ